MIKSWLSTSILPLAVAGAAGLAPNAACAQSVTVYGTLDLSVDSIRKSEGNVQGTLFGLSGGVPVSNAVAAPATSIKRMSSSLTRQSNFGIRGTEDLGSGWAAKFQIEGGLIPDTGGSLNDNRVFGRMTWVGLTTPAGEVRLGRQASPMLAGYYLNSVEHLGTTDLLAAGVTADNLQTFQDNVVSYLLARGPWMAQLSYSPNAGVASRVSAARSPAASDATGQIVGGASAGLESSSGRGKTTGALLSYGDDALRVILAYHHNSFDVPFGLVSAAGYVPLFNVHDFSSVTTGAKYRFAGTGTEIAGNFYRGKFTEAGGQDPRVTVFGAAVKQSIGLMDLIAQFTQARFDNFTRGKDTGFSLGGDYNLSRRTTLYLRFARMKDDRGNVVSASATPLPIAGGPLALLLPLGSLEVPIFSGAGTSMGATTQLFGVGMRHSF